MKITIELSVEEARQLLGSAEEAATFLQFGDRVEALEGCDTDYIRIGDHGTVVAIDYDEEGEEVEVEWDDPVRGGLGCIWWAPLHSLRKIE